MEQPFVLDFEVFHSFFHKFWCLRMNFDNGENISHQNLDLEAFYFLE